MLKEQRRKARGAYASAVARAARQPDDTAAAAAVRSARSDYYAEALADYIAETVGRAPDLSPAQRDKLILLLHAPDGGAAA